MWPVVRYALAMCDGSRNAPTGFRVHGTGIPCRTTFARGSGEYLIPLPGRPGDESPFDGAGWDVWKPPRQP